MTGIGDIPHVCNFMDYLVGKIINFWKTIQEDIEFLWS